MRGAHSEPALSVKLQSYLQSNQRESDNSKLKKPDVLLANSGLGQDYKLRPTYCSSKFLKLMHSVTQLCLTLCDPMDCSPPGSSVHGILQARLLDWVAMPSSRGFPTQGSNPHLLQAGELQADSLLLSHQGSLVVISVDTKHRSCELSGGGKEREGV